MPYLSRINGSRVVKGRTRVLADGRAVRLHGIRKWGKVYWTADKWGMVWEQDRTTAIAKATDLDIVSLTGGEDATNV